MMDPRRLQELEVRGNADLMEIFSSVQGEGPRAGERHLFVRTAHCDLDCVWCDTPLSHRTPARARIALPQFDAAEEVATPVAVESILAWIRDALRALPHRAVSFTGGEPLLHHWLITAAAATVRENGALVLLETDGTMPDRMKQVRHAVDIVSMDWKLPSATGRAPLDASHEAFLGEAAGLERIVKLVLTRECTLEDVRHVAARVAAVAKDAELILQPVTPVRGIEAPASADLLRFQSAALALHAKVRVLPQLHRVLALP